MIIGLCSSESLNDRRFISQEFATFSEASAPALRERHEPLFCLFCSDNHFIQLRCLSGREIVPERGWWACRGRRFPEGIEFAPR
jgi:hypothetical protein